VTRDRRIRVSGNGQVIETSLVMRDLKEPHPMAIWRNGNLAR
jgi:hypothetical protein